MKYLKIQNKIYYNNGNNITLIFIINRALIFFSISLNIINLFYFIEIVFDIINKRSFDNINIYFANVKINFINIGYILFLN